MFLMNAPPVLALRSAWEAFGPPGSCRFPRCFSEPREGVSRVAASAQVQMAISRLQGDGAALGMSGDHARPGSQRAERGRGSLPTASPAFAAYGLATGLDPKREEEEASNLGPLVPDSDSDDSVDRDIEEAIQEYLRAKSGAAPPPAAGDAARRCGPEPALSGAPAAPCPPNPAAGPSPVQGSASPLSVSSDDSFEQSIQAEIEQFLSEKRLHETQKGDLPADRKADPGDSLARATCRPGREPPLKAPQQDLPGTGKEFVFRKLPRSAKASALPRGLRCKVTAEPAAAATAGPPAEAAPSKGRVRRGAGSARKGRQPRSVALVHEEPDSSSDDGIEEAIRLYQRERRREVRGHQGPLPTEEKGPVAPAHSLRGPWPEALSKTPGKKKPAAPKATDLGPGGPDSEHPPRPPRETTAPVPPGSAAAESLGVDGSPCRADTSAELMCAEAILDISKTILPAPVDGGERPPPTSPLRQGPDGNSSAVDSDDSIEREIRTFLALKAQSGGPLPHTETCARPAHSPPLPPSLSAPAPDTADPSPGCRRRRSRMPCMPRRPRDTAEMQDAQDAERGQGRVQPGQGRAPEAPRRESESRGPPLPFKTGGPGDELGAPDPLGAAPPGPRQTAEGRRGDVQASSEEKSSSLDSDEDLDTAIKDLLRSKRRLRKRHRDPRASCKKRVRFSTTETQFLDKLGGFQKDWRDRSPHLLKSCLSKSRRDSRETPGRPPHIPSQETSRAKADGSGLEDAPSGPSAPWTRGRAAPRGLFSRESEAREPPGAARSPSSLSDDSSSIDSDDSIELEIRKFLAEKAKESVSGSEIPGGGPATLGTPTGARPELPGRKAPPPGPAAQPGMCTRSQRVRGGLPPGAEGPRGPGRALAPGGGSSPHPEQPCPPAALARCELAPPRSTSGPTPAKGSPAPRRNICAPRDSGPRGPEGVTGEGTFGQLPSHAEAGARVEGRSSLARTPGSQRDGVPRAGLALPWPDLSPQSRLQSTWVLGPEGRDVAAWRGGLGGQREKGPEGQARGSPSLATDSRRGLPFAGFSPLLSTQLFHFGKSMPWGAKQASLFSPGLGLPLQGPSFSAFREAQATRNPVFGSPRLLVKEGGRWPCRKPRAGLSLSDRRGSGPEESVLDLRFGRRGLDRDDEEPEALGSDASELSDTSVEEGGGPTAQGPVLQL
ncbi:protein phosphatase 1 regulatory subunit 26 [Bos indicus x Bos taurus]|uniref:Protein phosphatase 1 regulatory subunit 26 n=1 Tax=Bos indicus x Bos taurus TaxID=30522 RepID=A0A4W2HBK0_BOBOX|nr:protein phosphatase 1 regulatory subunit 26 [Bos indicus x Bos taurus]XP_027412659.1 protein phosphatase 1 regulatory subunit 26 [Bos indicus x Bos taurus]XP_027412660.1 protein phosphatase 1 regulatory subunit 26 [Bos indicus x Bos taurus]XP_027412662.1 protein phosphatase 1 regulatory subunit 26 [Bos indicus x Bos taurus]